MNSCIAVYIYIYVHVHIYAIAETFSIKKFLIAGGGFDEAAYQHLLRLFPLKSFSLQEDKSSAARKLIQPDLVAMSQLLNFDEEVRKRVIVKRKVFKISFKEEDASESEEEEVPEVVEELEEGELHMW